MPVLDKLLEGVSENDRLARACIPLLRAYVRYVPIATGKRSLWRRVIDPYFAWHSHDFVANTAFGCRMSGNTRELLQQYVYYFGMWEPQLSQWLTKRLQRGDTVVDVGANIGYFSLLASKLVGNSGRVVAVEASPATCELLRRNLALNRVSNVRVINKAASSSAGLVHVFRGPETHIGLTTVLESQVSERHAQYEAEVESAPLDQMLEPIEIQTVRVIKIDVEGAEWSVISAMSGVFEKSRADLEVTVEIDPQCLAEQDRTPEDVVNFFADHGFRPYYLENDYAATSYASRFHEIRPTRIRGPIDSVTDVVFSRVDAEVL